MDQEKIRTYAQQILAELGPPPPVVAPPISTPEALDAAISAAVSGDVLTLSTTLVYQAPFVLTKSIVLQSETWLSHAGEQMAADEPAPQFLNSFYGQADHHQVLGVEMRHVNPLSTIAVCDGVGAVWNRVRVLGDAVNYGKRGIDYRGSAGVISDSLVDYIAGKGIDTQAIYCQEMRKGGGLALRNNLLVAAGQAIMFGGGDPSVVEGIPSVISIDDCTTDKRPEWLALVKNSKGEDVHAWQCKCSIEFKNAIGAIVRNLTVKNAGGVSDGQGAYAFVCTPRNQGKHVGGPGALSTVQDVTIDGFSVDGGAGLLNLLGSDNDAISGPAKNIILRNGTVTGLDFTRYGKNRPDANGVLTSWNSPGRVFMVDRAPQGLTLENLKIAGIIKAAGYFSGVQPLTGFRAAGVTVPPSTYGWKVDGGTGKGGQGRAALLNYMPDAVLDPGFV